MGDRWGMSLYGVPAACRKDFTAGFTAGHERGTTPSARTLHKQARGCCQVLPSEQPLSPSGMLPTGRLLPSSKGPPRGPRTGMRQEPGSKRREQVCSQQRDSGPSRPPAAPSRHFSFAQPVPVVCMGGRPTARPAKEGALLPTFTSPTLLLLAAGQGAPREVPLLTELFEQGVLGENPV